MYFMVWNLKFAEITYRSAYHGDPRPAADAQVSRKRIRLRFNEKCMTREWIFADKMRSKVEHGLYFTYHVAGQSLN